MRLEMFSKDINLELFYQFKDMIFMLSTKDYNKAEVNSTVLGFVKPDKSLQDIYGLKYPGEVLERYKEKGLCDSRDERAICLALTECIPALQPTMFTEDQLTNFLNTMRQAADRDLYLMCALLQWEEDKDIRLELCSKINRLKNQTDAHVIYSLQYVKNFAGGWNLLEERLAYMLYAHSINVYENADVLVWLHREYYEEVMHSKNSCARVLKVLFQLFDKWMNNTSKEFVYLSGFGYTEQEIVYLNMYLSNCWNNSKEREGYRAIQKIVVKGCQYFISAKVLENDCIISVCIDCLRNCTTLVQNVKGNNQLASVLEFTRIGTLKMLEALWKYREKDFVNKSWFYVDIIDSEWSNLVAVVGPTKYREIMENVMFESETDLTEYINIYNELCNSEYCKDVLDKVTSECEANIDRLVDAGVIDIQGLLKDFNESDLQQLNARRLVRAYLKGDANINKVSRWEYVVSTYDLETLNKIMGVDRFISAFVGVNVNARWYTRLNPLSSYSERDKELLFEWTLQETYNKYACKYNEVLIKFLLEWDMSFIQEEVVLDLCNTLLEEDISKQDKMKLLQKYKAEEYEVFCEKEREEQVLKRQQEVEDAKEQWKQKLEQEIAEAENTVESFIEAFSSYDRWKSGYSQIVLDTFIENLENMTFTDSQLKSITKELLDLVNGKYTPDFSFEQFRAVIMSLGV